MVLLEPSSPVRLRLAAIGDVGIVGAARARAAREGWDTPFAALAPALSAADLGFANLEFPVGEAGWVRGGRSAEFRHDPEVVAALARAGVGIVSLANNHMMDCGRRGLERTLEACAAAGLAVAGAGADLDAARAPAQIECAGRRLALLAYGAASDDAATRDRPGIAPLQSGLVREDLARWRPRVDLLVVSVHWGSMYVDYPPPRVLELARVLEQAGADLILGHHPHVIQGCRRSRAHLTLFSLGDGAFNCRAGDFHARIAAETRLLAAVFTAVIAAEPGLEAEPFVLDQDGFPRPADAASAEALRARFQRLSAGLANGASRFDRESAPQLLRYELESLSHYVRQGRWGRIAKLIASVRPRHLPVLWQALRRIGRPA